MLYMYNRIIYSDNSVNLSGSYLGISCHKLAASGGKYKFISGKYFVSETWIFFFFLLYHMLLYRTEPKDQNMGKISSKSVLLTYSSSLWI